MWIIAQLDLSEVPASQAFMSDGRQVVGVSRGGRGASERLMIAGVGWLDITELGPNENQGELAIGDQPYSYAGTASISMSVNSDRSALVAGDGHRFTVLLSPFPSLDRHDLAAFERMQKMRLIPYPDVPPNGRPFSAVAQTARNMFAWSGLAETLGLAVYDWTTADFFRMDVFNYFQYTRCPGRPLAGDQIVQAIWTASWPPYQPSDPDFMASMLMTACSSEAEVADEYERVTDELKTLLDALKRITAVALQSMPRTSALAVPRLYSGQVDVSNLSANAFATYFEEDPGNAGPPPASLGMPLAQALGTFLAPGRTVKLKSFLSATDSESDALHYSNGILLAISPPGRPPVWQTCAHVTPLSDEADKTEYLFMPGSQFAMGQSRQVTIGGKHVTLIEMTATGIAS